jgi:hypothetical protein
MAGEPYLAKTHYIGRSKPCLDKVTRGALQCPYCGPIELRDTLYVPLWNLDLERIVVVAGTRELDKIRRIRAYSRVWVVRGDQPQSAVKILPETNLVTELGVIPGRTELLDFTFWLPVMWKVDELKTWCKLQAENMLRVGMSDESRAETAPLPSPPPTERPATEEDYSKFRQSYREGFGKLPPETRD